MTFPARFPIDKVQRVVREVCTRHGVMLVTPESPSVLREAVHLTIAAATPLTFEEARGRVSFYLSKLLPEVIGLIRAAAPWLPDPELSKSVISLSPTVWEDLIALVGTAAHELVHHGEDCAARGSQGVLGSVTHGGAYLLCDCVRGNSEGLSYTQNLTAEVVLGGRDPAVYIEGVLSRLKTTYRLGDTELENQRRTLSSCADSLRAEVLHGVGSPVEELFHALVAEGMTLPSPWSERLAA